jgi:hypothetical protein
MIFIIAILISLSVNAKSKMPTSNIKLQMDSNISYVVSSDSWKDTVFDDSVSPQYRFRAIVFDPLESESQGKLIVEKYIGEDSGVPARPHFSKEVKLISTKEMQDTFKKGHFEAVLGCCIPINVKWDKFKLLYDVHIAGSKFSCFIDNVNKSLNPICKRYRK